MNDVPVKRVKEFQNKFTEYLSTRKAELLSKIEAEQVLSKDLMAELKAAARRV
jgi:F-type H+-transporting ATPase subunit alpha